MATDEARRQAWNERYAEREYVWTVEPNRFVAGHLADVEPGTAIDLAAGEGRNAVWLATRGWEVSAVDFSSTGLAKAERLATDAGVAIDLVEADATTYDPGRTVDLVLLAYLQLPTDERRTVLEHAVTWVAPGGTFLLVAHDRSNVDGGHGGPSSPEVCYTPDEVTAVLDGFDITIAEVAERPVATDDGERIALDTLVVATRR